MSIGIIIKYTYVSFHLFHSFLSLGQTIVIIYLYNFTVVIDVFLVVIRRVDRSFLFNWLKILFNKCWQLYTKLTLNLCSTSTFTYLG